jgi:uncharacterized protein YyaL (SSP411 family)
MGRPELRGLWPPGNQLAGQASPYLSRHAGDPVAWRPWGGEALAEARRLGRPVLLSIGFASCHWCHVMARESFQDPDLAERINALVVPVKVDREERPDVDGVYQQALERLGGRKGWPLTLLLTPDGEAYDGGTYLDPPALLALLERPAGQRPSEQVRPAAAAPAAPLDLAALDAAAMEVLAAMDPLAGGLRGAPKFPNLGVVELLLRAGARRGDEAATHAALRSLEAMSNGGLYDHLDGGYARYCVDAHWRTPHYEKMLYDNARFVSLLSLAWRRSRRPVFETRVRETIVWLDRRLGLASGAFAASLSAEAAGVEGGAQTWTHAQVVAALGAEAGVFMRHYEVAPPGAPAAPLRRLRAPVPGVAPRIDQALDTLRALQARRPRPARDDKVLADWNALAIRALAEAALAFAEPVWLARARCAWAGLTKTLKEPDGRLWHARGTPAFLQDHAAVGLAALALYEAGGDRGDLDHALAAAGAILAPFAAPHGGFLQAEPDQASPLAPRVPLADDGCPSGNALALELLARLVQLAETPDALVAPAAALLKRAAGEALADPIGHAGLLNAADTWLRGAKAQVLGDAPTLRDAVLALADPVILLTSSPEGPGHLIICRDRTCGLPVTNPAAVAAAFHLDA